LRRLEQKVLVTTVDQPLDKLGALSPSKRMIDDGCYKPRTPADSGMGGFGKNLDACPEDSCSNLPTP